MESLIKKHLYDNIRGYLILLAFLLIGTAAGSYCAFGYGESVAAYMKEFILSAEELFKTSALDLNGVFKTAFETSFLDAVSIWLLGFTVIGTVGIWLLIAKNGFMCGFITGFLIRLSGFEGFGMAAIIILIKCVIYIPAIMFLACMAAKFSIIIFRMITGRIKYRINLKYFILRYFCYLVIIVLVLVIYSLGEAYIVTNLLKLYLK